LKPVGRLSDGESLSLEDPQMHQNPEQVLCLCTTRTHLPLPAKGPQVRLAGEACRIIFLERFAARSNLPFVCLDNEQIASADASRIQVVHKPAIGEAEP
jgi:hypothetical protein